MEVIGFKLYLLFVLSWFLHLPSRLPFLGAVRFDLLLVAALCVCSFMVRERSNRPPLQTDRYLRILIAYSILTIPLVQWPGSVIRFGLPDLVKAIVFYYFTISFVKTEKDLKVFILVFLVAQTWRILEPLYLHLTQGYWGSAAYMGNAEFLNRLSGAPHDVINPNGLAFVICSVFPFIYFMGAMGWKWKVAFGLMTPLSLYALVLTNSRSGIVGLIVILIGIVMKSKRRAVIGLVGILVAIVTFSTLNEDMKDRYLSIVGMGQKNRATFEGRYEGVMADFQVMLNRPVFGHGLGTSLEANANFRGVAQPSHNLFTEVGQELGFAGLIIFLLFIKSIISNFGQSCEVLKEYDEKRFLKSMGDSMQVWLGMNIIFSFASYGLTSYEWYLFGGLSVVLRNLVLTTRTN